MSIRSDERRRDLLDLARLNGHVQVVEESERLGVASETVRRDLKVLEDQGLVRRTHGGAFPVESVSFESSMSARSGSRVAEKRRIAAAAVGLVNEAESIYLDEGYTPQLVAELLAQVERPLTVVTPSLSNASILATSSRHTVIMLGGRVRPRTLATVDHTTVRQLQQLHTDVAFLGANGITREQGLTTPDPAVAAVKEAAVASSRRRIFIGTFTKFGVVNFCQFAAVDDFEAIVTETALPSRESALYSAMGPQVIRV